jgi:hypothetical protein
MAQQFGATAHLLKRLADHTEDFIGFGATRVLVDARWLAGEACMIAEDHAKEETLGA